MNNSTYEFYSVGDKELLVEIFTQALEKVEQDVKEMWYCCDAIRFSVHKIAEKRYWQSFVRVYVQDMALSFFTYHYKPQHAHKCEPWFGIANDRNNHIKRINVMKDALQRVKNLGAY